VRWVQAARQRGARLALAAGVRAGRTVRRRSSSRPGSTLLFSGPGKRSLQITGGRVYWTTSMGALFSAPITAPPFCKDLEVPYGLENFRVEGTTIYLVTFDAGELSVWRHSESDDAPLLLGKVATKATNYTGNPFGGAHVLVDERYVYFPSTWSRLCQRAREMGWCTGWRNEGEVLQRFRRSAPQGAWDAPKERGWRATGRARRRCRRARSAALRA
jgi:hypothetical protein